MEPLGRQADRVVLPVAVATVILGVIRGTVLGQVKSVDVLLGTAYGLTFLVALVASLATLAWSRYYTKAADRAFAAVRTSGTRPPRRCATPGSSSSASS